MVDHPHPRVAVLSGARTPIGKYGGSLRAYRAPELGAVAARAALERARVAPTEIEEVVIGHGILAGVGQNPARQVQRACGIPDEFGAVTVSMVCGSGMKAIHVGAAYVRAGEFDRVLVGGMESMSNAPFLVDGGVRWGVRPGARPLEDSMQWDSLTDAYDDHELMGLTGERIASKLSITRAEVDQFALRSNLRAAQAVASGLFDAEIAPVPPDPARGAPGLARDESPKADVTLEGLAKLKPAFTPKGVLTAGNSSRLADGGAALVLASEREVERRKLRPLAWIHSTGEGGVHPRDVMEAPIPTVRKHLERTGLGPGDFDRVEHNEAFSSASIGVQRAFGFADDRFNVNGGAVALGHPIGMSGARIAVTLLYELARANGRLGLATLCMGGGNGLSLVLERDRT